MSNINRYFSAFVLIFLIFSTIEAQTNPVYKIMKQRGWIPYKGNDKAELIAHAIKEVPISLGYNDTIVSNLQKIGVDLLKPNVARPWDEKYLTAISDCIVIGTVVRKEYCLEVRSWFHTIVYIQVGEYLRNDYNLPLTQIPVMIQSGPNNFIVGEDTLKIGEHVLLFLDANGLIRMANNNRLDNLYNKVVNDSTIWFKIVRKYELENGKAIIRDKSKDLDEIRDNINAVLSVIF
jgi:hypothetical protein